MTQTAARAGAPTPGTVLAGKYVVERVLGAGAMGVVVSVRHRVLGQRLAIKLIADSREARPIAIERFTREAQAVAGLTSDHIVRVQDFGVLDDGTPFMVMDHLDGRDLAAEVRANGRGLPVVDAVDYVIQACAGLAVAHAAGIVHRDIKPGNLVLTRRSRGEPLVVIVDFGISKVQKGAEDLTLTASQTTLGSPHYMSPEQIRDAKRVDARTDIWSLGVVLRFLLTGNPPFAARDASGVLAAVIADTPPPLVDEAPEVPEALAAVVERCLQKRAEFRYASVAELAHALAPYASPAGQAIASTFAKPGAEPAPADPSLGAPRATFASETFSSMTRMAPIAPAPRAGAFVVAAVVALGGALALALAPWRAPERSVAQTAPVAPLAADVDPPRDPEPPSIAPPVDAGHAAPPERHTTPRRTRPPAVDTPKLDASTGSAAPALRDPLDTPK
jgi:serine/threonine-protein kinase